MTRRVVLVVGGGGREHALGLAMSADAEVHLAPGNPGTAAFATNHPVDILDGAAVAVLASEIGADLVVIGPEAPLVAGVADVVRATGMPCFGPSADAAKLEGSKSFAKQIMAEAGVPTAGAIVCQDDSQLRAALERFGPPYVVKLDGLAAGKGVIVTEDIEAAFAHGSGAGEVLVEEYLDGPEVSLFVITDGVNALALQPAQDFKRVGDGDAGPNTGGMGAYSPLPWLDGGMVDQVMAEVVQPTLETMAARGTPFAGLLYVGLAITSNGPKVVEFNCRFGDPETEAVLPLLDESLTEVLLAAATGRLGERAASLRFCDAAAVCVVLASEGYPGPPRQGGKIVLPPDNANAHTIQAGTASTAGGLVAAGGRVLAVVGKGATLGAARDAAYEHIAAIDFADGFHRSDIALAAAEAQAKTSEEK